MFETNKNRPKEAGDVPFLITFVGKPLDFLEMGHYRPPFLYFRLFNTVLNIIFAYDWFWTADLWNWKQPHYQLGHNHCPNFVRLSQHILAFICGFAYVTNGILTIDGIQFFTFFLVLNIFRIISIVLPAALISWQV